MKNLNRIVWVGYNRTHGFMKGKVNATWTEDFSKARLYGRKSDVISSSKRLKNRIPDGETIIPIPIKMNLEEEVAIILKLGGTPCLE
jgi:hypothetical protein